MLGRFVNTAKHYRLDMANRLAEWRWKRREARWEKLQALPPKLVTVNSRNGRMTIQSHDAVIGRTLYLHRNWEFDLVSRTASVLRQHGLLSAARSTMIDVGANIGSTTVAFLRQGVFRSALAIEPEALNFELLERNVRQNGLAERVATLRIAAGAAEGQVELEVASDNLGDHRIRATAAPGAYGEMERATRIVRMTTLDDALAGLSPRRDFAISSIGLLWIDVQGFEGHVLAGASGLLEARVPIEMELWPYGLERAGTSRDQLLRTIGAAYGKVVDLRDPALRVRSTDELGAMYAALEGPFADTEILLFA